MSPHQKARHDHLRPRMPQNARGRASASMMATNPARALPAPPDAVPGRPQHTASEATAPAKGGVLSQDHSPGQALGRVRFGPTQAARASALQHRALKILPHRAPAHAGRIAAARPFDLGLKAQKRLPWGGKYTGSPVVLPHGIQTPDGTLSLAITLPRVARSSCATQLRALRIDAAPRRAHKLLCAVHPCTAGRPAGALRALRPRLGGASCTRARAAHRPFGDPLLPRLPHTNMLVRSNPGRSRLRASIRSCRHRAQIRTATASCTAFRRTSRRALAWSHPNPRTRLPDSRSAQRTSTGAARL